MAKPQGRRKPKAKRPRGEWVKVRVAGGTPVLAYWEHEYDEFGWVRPWFCDGEMAHGTMGQHYFSDEPERAPTMTQSGRWQYRDDDNEIVELTRARRSVVLCGERLVIPLNDGGDMGWCWEICGVTSSSHEKFIRDRHRMYLGIEEAS